MSATELPTRLSAKEYNVEPGFYTVISYDDLMEKYGDELELDGLDNILFEKDEFEYYNVKELYTLLNGQIDPEQFIDTLASCFNTVVFCD